MLASVLRGESPEIRAFQSLRQSLVKEEDTTAYWDQKWGLRKQHLQENVTLDGSDGEDVFDQELQRQARGKEVLDVGCGPGEFTLNVAKDAKSIIGIDSSRTALDLAEGNLERAGIKNASFGLGDIKCLPFPDESFDLVYSRRGPASVNKHCLSEVLRVLKRGGAFAEITIGERDKQNLAHIFGRGQMLRFRGQVSVVKKRWLKEVGFERVVSRDYLGTEIFHSLDDLVVRLSTAPIIPSFDSMKDRLFLKRVKDECTTDRGVETPVHRVVLVARK
jgi:SAM-dependent methyltransferase